MNGRDIADYLHGKVLHTTTRLPDCRGAWSGDEEVPVPLHRLFHIYLTDSFPVAHLFDVSSQLFVKLIHVRHGEELYLRS